MNIKRIVVVGALALVGMATYFFFESNNREIAAHEKYKEQVSVGNDVVSVSQGELLPGISPDLFFKGITAEKHLVFEDTKRNSFSVGSPSSYFGPEKDFSSIVTVVSAKFDNPTLQLQEYSYGDILLPSPWDSITIHLVDVRYFKDGSIISYVLSRSDD